MGVSLMFIKIKGHTGSYNAVVTAFYKDNLEHLKKSIKFIYGREYGNVVPDGFDDISTIKDLKKFIKEEMSDMDNYPYGFKHIEGIYCLYECIG